jgi:hypothetical protein
LRGAARECAGSESATAIIPQCQRRSKNASVCRRENTSMIVAKRPPNWGPFRQASGFGGVIRGRV